MPLRRSQTDRNSWAASILLASSASLFCAVLALAEPPADDELRRAMQELEARLRVNRIADGIEAPDAFDRQFFGRDAETLRRDLDAHLQRHMYWVYQVCQPTREQLDKLELAGRGDVRRLLERIGEASQAYDRVVGDAPAAQQVIKEQIGPLREAAGGKLLGPDSLFARTLSRTFSPEQIARYDPRLIPAYQNLSQITQAMRRYHAAFGRFPPAVLTGPDGSTPYSWRVELLPLLASPAASGPGAAPGPPGGDSLRAAHWQAIERMGYRLDEPWDGPRNREFAQRIPEQYRHPSDAAQSTHAGFFVTTGRETVFSGERGTAFDELLAPAYTILMVEARRDIPWTKCEDIPYAPDRPLPALGGFDNYGFLAATCDGKLRLVPPTAGELELRTMLTRLDKERTTKEPKDAKTDGRE